MNGRQRCGRCHPAHPSDGSLVTLDFACEVGRRSSARSRGAAPPARRGPGVPRPKRSTRESDHRAAEPEPGPESATRPHAPQYRELRGRSAAGRVAP